jgi:hypothetical protein
MATTGAARQKTSVVLSAEARELLLQMARESGLSQSAVLELAIREKAGRESITVTGSGSAVRLAATARRQAAARARFRELVEKARAGFADLTPEEIEREVDCAVAEVRESRRAGRR